MRIVIKSLLITLVVLNDFPLMLFSKSFGYAVRAILYIAMVEEEYTVVQAEEIAEKLSAPRHYISKILKRLVKAGVLHSSKGKAGGFGLNQDARQKPLIEIYELTDGMDNFHTCSLRLQECNAENPCPVHYRIVDIRTRLKTMLADTTISDLLSEQRTDFLGSIATAV